MILSPPTELGPSAMVTRSKLSLGLRVISARMSEPEIGRTEAPSSSPLLMGWALAHTDVNANRDAAADLMISMTFRSVSWMW